MLNSPACLLPKFILNFISSLKFFNYTYYILSYVFVKLFSRKIIFQAEKAPLAIDITGPMGCAESAGVTYTEKVIRIPPMR